MHVSAAQLNHLANLYDIKTSYQDMSGSIRPASGESLLAVLKALDAPISGLSDVPSAIREKQQAYWLSPLEPVTVFRQNDVPAFNLRLPESLAKAPVSAFLTMESGEKRNFYWRNDSAAIVDSAEIEGTKYFTLRCRLPEILPIGYHKLHMDLPGRISETLIISAPLKAYNPSEMEKIWGVFLPLYALHTRKSWGAGDFSDLDTLMQWVAELGGQVVGTLPLLPSFFDGKMGPGPYMPASRLFWNEFYVDISRIPELDKCPSAQALINSTDFQKELAVLRSSHVVDYSRQLSLKRQILEILTEFFFSEKSDRFSDLLSFTESHNSLEDYARFRAAGEQNGLCWNYWPRMMRDGKLKEGDYSEKIKQYYLYTQWVTHEQLRNLSQKGTTDNLYLYLDLPVGVHPYSYDVWRERESFVSGICGGAPPDPVFTSGQNWGFPPLHPEKVRHQGYRYVIASFRHQLEQARMLRIDHMMNFHRLFWIPEGMENRDGVYVGYRAEELYAILALESYHHKSIIIGEDLGIVPPEVRPMMDKYGIYRMYVGQYELITENQLGKIPPNSVASMNTHDMFPFASFWQENDIPERLNLKLTDPQGAQKEMEQRREIKRILISALQYKGLDNEVSQDAQETLKAALNLMAGSPTYALLVNLEDLWLETHPQNIPGTHRSQNWSRKARYAFEEFSQLSGVIDILHEIHRHRGEC